MAYTAPSRADVIAYAKQVAKRYGLDEATFLRVVEGESGFNPAAVGDQGHSKGIAQLYDKGLAPQFTKITGLDPGDPSTWMQALDFMGQQVAQGGQGYGPWHAAANQGIGQFQGVTPPQPGLSSPTFPKPPPLVADGSNPFGGMDINQWKDMWGIDPKGGQTLGAKLVDAFIPGRADLRQSQRSPNLFALGFNALTGNKEFADPVQAAKDKAAEAATKGFNPFSPLSDKDQLAAIAKKPTLGTTLANYIAGSNPNTAVTLNGKAVTPQPKKRTLSQGLFSMFSGQPPTTTTAMNSPTTLGGSALSGLFGLFG